MKRCRAGRELRKGSNGVADVRTTGDVGIKEFTQNSAVGEAMLFLKSMMFWGVFGRTIGGVKGREAIHGKRGAVRAGGGFVRGRSVPAVSFEDTGDVRMA